MARCTSLSDMCRRYVNNAMSTTRMTNVPQDMLVAIEKCEFVQSADRHFDLTLLSSEARSALSDGAHRPIASRRGSQLRIFRVSDAFTILLMLHRCMSRMSGVAYNILSTNCTSNAEMGVWQFKTLQRAEQALNRWIPWLPHNHQIPLMTMALETSSALVSSTLQQQRLRIMILKVARLHLALIAVALHCFTLSGCASPKVQVAQALQILMLFENSNASDGEELLAGLVPSLTNYVSSLFPQTESTESLQELSLAVKQNHYKAIDARNAINKVILGLQMSVQEESMDSVDSMDAELLNSVERLKRNPVNDAFAQTDAAAASAENSEPLKSLCHQIHLDGLQTWNTLVDTLLDVFIESNEIVRNDILGTIRNLICTGIKPTHLDVGNAHEISSCDVCGRTSRGSEVASNWHLSDWKGFHDLLAELVNSPTIHLSPQQKANLVMSTRAFVRHSPVLEHRDVANDAIGKWTMQTLRSPSRELRLAAIHTLIVYVEPALSLETPLCRKNRVVLMDILRGLLDTEDARFQEVSIIMISHIAIVCDEEEQNILLLALVEFLGAANAFVSTLAHLELRNMAQTYSSSPQDLFKPFWRTIAITAVQDLVTCPQKTQQLAEILGMTIAQFLVLTEVQTLPWLVLLGKQDVLQRLASAHSTSTSVWSLCMMKHNLPPVLALLMVQEPAKAEATVLQLLQRASHEFKGLDVSNLLRSDIVPTACEILKLTGDGDAVSRDKVRTAFVGSSCI